MSNKITFVNKYENYKERKGTVNKQESVCDKSKAVDVDIYACIEKYGITSLARQTQANEYLYEDITNKPKDLHEALEMRKRLNEYFENQPARVRKQFGDNADIFIEKFQRGDFNDMIKTGVLSNELANRYLEEMKTNEQTNTTTLEQPTTNSENISTNTN